MSKYFDLVVESMKKNQAFQNINPLDEENLASCFDDYIEWLGSEYKILKQGEELKAIEEELLLINIGLNQSYQEDLKKNQRGLYNQCASSFGDIETLFALSQNIRKALLLNYSLWAHEMLENIKNAMNEEILKNYFLQDERDLLFHRLDQAQKTIQEARDARLEYLDARYSRHDLKREILSFLKWKRFLGITNLKIRNLVEKLQGKIEVWERDWESSRKREREIVETYEQVEKARRQTGFTHPSWGKEEPKLSKELKELREKIDGLFKNLRQAREYIQALQLAGSRKAEAQQRQRENSIKGAEKEFKQINKDIKKENKLFKSRSQQSKKTLEGFSTRNEGLIEARQEELDNLILVESVELALRIDRLEEFLRDMERARKQVGYLPGILAEKQPEYQRELEKAKKEKTELQLKIMRLMEVIALAGSNLSGVTTGLEEEMNEQRRLLLQREAAKNELVQLKKLAKIDKALNVYCSLYSYSFGLFLSIGNVVGGDGGSLTSKSKVGKAMEFLGKHCILGGIPPTSKAYDTGSFGLSLKLGVSFGPDLGGVVSSKIGLALELNSGINVSDNRRFQSVSSMALKASIGAEIPKLFKGSIEAELFRDQTVFVFQDHYHWAAWVSQKWSRIAAMVYACDKACMERRMDQFKQPTPDEMAELQKIADITMKSNPHLRAILDEIAQYTNYGVVRVENRAIMTGIKASVDFADGFLGAGVSGERPTDVKFYRLMKGNLGNVLVDSQGYERVETKTSRAWNIGGSISVVGVTGEITYIDIKNHSVPDNDGQSLNIKLKFPGLSGLKFGVEAPPSPSSLKDCGFGDWIKENLVPKAEDTKMSDWVSGFSEKVDMGMIQSITRTLDLAVLEFNLLHSEVERKKEWVLQYWRCIFNTGSSLEVSVPLDPMALWHFDIGVSFNVSRTYWEHLGDNTMTYVQTVYNGFKNIPAQTSKVTRDKSSTARPEEAWGATLWERYKENHQHELWSLLLGMSYPKSWARKEVLGTRIMEGKLLVQRSETIAKSIRRDPLKALAEADYDWSFFTVDRYNTLVGIMENYLEKVAQQTALEQKSTWTEVPRVSDQRKSFEKTVSGMVKDKDKDYIEFLNLAKTLKQKMSGFKKKGGFFSRDKSFTLEDCKEALEKAGGDMEKAFEILKGMAKK